MAVHTYRCERHGDYERYVPTGTSPPTLWLCPVVERQLDKELFHNGRWQPPRVGIVFGESWGPRA